MPALTRWTIKSALLYLVAALVLALVLALDPFVPWFPAFVPFLLPVYLHVFMVGWVTQMIFGVVYWMFPIVTRARPRGNEQLAWAVFVLLNIGLLLRVVAEPLLAVRPEAIWGWMLVISAVLQWLAAVAFVYNSWPRVKERYRGE